MCGANCDPGEIKNGICFDCQLELKKQEQVRQEVDRMARATDYEQLEMEGFLK